jgi:hypothetical protein
MVKNINLFEYIKKTTTLIHKSFLKCSKVLKILNFKSFINNIPFLNDKFIALPDNIYKYISLTSQLNE